MEKNLSVIAFIEIPPTFGYMVNLKLYEMCHKFKNKPSKKPDWIEETFILNISQVTSKEKYTPYKKSTKIKEKKYYMITF